MKVSGQPHVLMKDPWWPLDGRLGKSQSSLDDLEKSNIILKGILKK
jgi:hypothetical protein